VANPQAGFFAGCNSAAPRNPIAGVDSALTGARNSHESMMTDDEIPPRLAGDDVESDVSSGLRAEQGFRRSRDFRSFFVWKWKSSSSIVAVHLA